MKRLTVATSDDNVEVLTVLSLVGCRLLSNGVSVDGALDVGDGRRVFAFRTRVFARVALKVDVETQAVLLLVAEVGTGLHIILSRLNVLVGEVSNLLSRAGKISEGLCVTSRGFRVLGNFPQLAVAGCVCLNRAVTRDLSGTMLMLVKH
jgi:hypothetical protein